MSAKRRTSSHDRSESSSTTPSLEELATEVDQIGSEQLVMRRLLNELQGMVRKHLANQVATAAGSEEQPSNQPPDDRNQWQPELFS